MTEKEKLIQDLHNITVNTEAGTKKIGQVTKYWHLEAIAQFIIEDRKRICEPLLAVKESVTGMMRIETISLILAQANTKTLKLAGLGDEK